MNIKNAVDKAYEGKSLNEILESPLAALQGVSEKDGELMKEAFKISTVAQFSHFRFGNWASAIQELAKYEKDAGDGGANIDHALDKAWEDKSFEELLEAPVAAFQGLSDRQGELLAEAFNVKTIKQLANLKYFNVAKAIASLAVKEG